MKAALLTPNDVGSGFTADYSQGDAIDGPCNNAPAVEKTVPEQARADVAITSDTVSQEVDETIYRYADDATASKAVAAMHAQIACSSGQNTDQGVSVTFTITTADIGSPGDERFGATVKATAADQGGELDGQVATIRHRRYEAAHTFDWDPSDPALPTKELIGKATAKLVLLP
jgi:hypothetical protein